MTPWFLLHGFLGCRRDFDPLIEALDAPSLHAIDLPGHGEQPNRFVETSFDDGVAQLAEEIDGITGEPGWLLGYSMGGRLALALLASQPQRLRGVVAVGANIGITDPRLRQQRLAADRQLAERLETGDLSAFVDDWYRQPLFAPLRRQPAFENLRQRRCQGDQRSLAAALRTFSVGRQSDFRPVLARSPVPVLLIAGALDTKYCAQNTQLQIDLSGIHCHEIEGAGHCVPLEQPTALAEIVSAFATRH